MENRSVSGTLGAILTISISILLFVADSGKGLQDIRPQHDKVVVCYVSSWATYRPERGSFSIENLRPQHCTHLIYAFVGLNASTSSIRIMDPWADLGDGGGKDGYRKITALRGQHPGLKVSVAIGGWNEGSANYSELAASPDRRRIFVNSAVDFVRKYSFDGLDLDWEFPGLRGGAPHDKENFVLLVKELSQAFKSKRLMLTAALGAGIETIGKAYDIPELSKYLDYIHVMAYDYHGTWDGRVLANAPLRHSDDLLTVEDSIRHFLKLGAPRNKLVLGLPTYGRTFILKDPIPSVYATPMGRDALPKGFQGPFTKEDGFMGYNEICTLLADNNLGWRQGWDKTTMTPWAVKEDRAIAYDDPKSLMMKADFASEMKLAGVMVWSIDTDDFHGDCYDLNAEIVDPLLGSDYPLMRSINMALAKAPKSENSDTVSTTEKPNSSVRVGSFSCFFIISVLLSYIN